MWSCHTEQSTPASSPTKVDLLHSDALKKASPEQIIYTLKQFAAAEGVEFSIASPTSDESAFNECFEKYLPNSTECVGEYTSTFTVRSYGCPVKIKATWTPCFEDFYGSGNIVFVVKEYTISFVYIDRSNQECSDLVDTLIKYYNDYQRGDVIKKILFDKLIRDLFFQAELNWDEEFIKTIGLNNCQNPNTDGKTIIEYYKGFCEQWCLKFIRDENGNLIKFYPLKLTCGRLCCVRRSEFCYDIDKEEIVRETTIQDLEPCTYEEPDPYPGCDFLGDCRATCSK